MRIAVWYNLPSGGARRALHDHVAGLLARGHTVEAWCPPTADRAFLPFGPAVKEHLVPLQWPDPNRRDTWQLTLHTERALAAMEDHCRRCAQAMDAGGFDIVFANTCRFFATSPIGRLARTPAVLYLQEPMRTLYEALPRLPWLARPAAASPAWRPANLRAAFADIRTIRNLRLQGRAEVENAAGFRRILVNSFFSRESVLRAYGVDADVCYLGIDTARFCDVDRPREGFVLGLGAVTPNKNVEFCIEAVAALPTPRPRLAWIGNMANPAYLDRLHALATARGVTFEPRIRITDEELVDTLSRAAVLAYAPRLEPFGLAPLEANACGLPAVAVAEGGVRETVQDGVTGLLVPPDPAAMATSIARLLADPAFARTLGANASRIARERWSLAPATERLEQHLVRHAQPRPA